MEKEQEINARIRVEQLIREERLVQAYTVLETFIDLIQTRAAMLKKCKEVPADMVEAILTIMFASERIRYDIDEIYDISSLLKVKFGKEFIKIFGKNFDAEINDELRARDMGANNLVIAFLSVMPAPPAEKIERLKKISLKHKVPFDEERAEQDLNPKKFVKMPDVLEQSQKPSNPMMHDRPIAPMPVMNQPAQYSGTNFNKAQHQTLPTVRPPNPIPRQHKNNSSSSQLRQKPEPPSDQTSENAAWQALPPVRQDLGYGFTDTLAAATAYVLQSHRSGSYEKQSPGLKSNSRDSNEEEIDYNNDAIPDIQDHDVLKEIEENPPKNNEETNMPDPSEVSVLDQAADDPLEIIEVIKQENPPKKNEETNMPGDRSEVSALDQAADNPPKIIEVMKQVENLDVDEPELNEQTSKEVTDKESISDSIEALGNVLDSANEIPTDEEIDKMLNTLQEDNDAGHVETATDAKSLADILRGL